MKYQEAYSLMTAMRSERRVIESDWKSICHHIAPYATMDAMYGDFLLGKKQTKRGDLPYRGFVQNVSRQAAAIVMGHLLEGIWHQIKFRSPALNERDEAQDYLEQFRDVLFEIRGRPDAAFSEAMQDATRAGLDFGILPLRVYRYKDRLAYYSPSPSGIYVREDGRGRLVAVAQSYQLRAKDAVAQFGNLVSNEIKTAAKDEKDAQTFTFTYLCSKEGDDYWCGYIDEKHKNIIWQTTEPNVPLVVARFGRGQAGYGDCPGRAVIQDVAILHGLEKMHYMNSGLAATPPWMTHENITPENAPSIRPNAILSGMIDARGQAMMQPLSIPTMPQISEKQIERLRDTIQQSYFADILNQSNRIPNATATAVAALEESRRMRMSSVAARMESELFSPMVAAEIQTLQAIDYAREARGEKALLPEMPESLLAYAREQNLPLGLRIEYTGYVQKAMRERKAASVQELAQHTAMIAQIDPRAVQKFDGAEAIAILAEHSDAPARVLRDDTDIAAEERKQRRAEAQAAQAEIMAQQEARSGSTATGNYEQEAA